jgi:hypothetical protein
VFFNTFILYSQLVLGMIIGLFSTRKVLKNLGENDYGIYILVAGVIGPIKIKGTLDDLEFYEAQTGENLVRMKKRFFFTSKEFHSNTVYQPIIDQGKEFGFAVKLTKTFRSLVHDFNEKAKDQSYAGRAIKLLLEIIKEDIVNPPGQCTLAEAMKDYEVASYLEGFEGN